MIYLSKYLGPLPSRLSSHITLALSIHIYLSTYLISIIYLSVYLSILVYVWYVYGDMAYMVYIYLYMHIYIYIYIYIYIWRFFLSVVSYIFKPGIWQVMMMQNHFERVQVLLVIFNWGYIWLGINISQLSIFLLEISCQICIPNSLQSSNIGISSGANISDVRIFGQISFAQKLP